MINWVPGITLENVEQMTIEAALKFYRGNKTQTATALGIAIRTLDNKLEKYEEDRRDREQARIKHASHRQSLLDHQRGLVPNGPHNSAGLRVEPVVEVAAEPKVSVPERPKVQEVLPKQTAKRGSGGAR